MIRILTICSFLAAMVFVSPVLAQGTKKNATNQNTDTDTNALTERIKQLEEQLIDMQGMIGALQSFAKSGRQRNTSSAESGITSVFQPDRSQNTSNSGRFSSGALAEKVESLETQVRAVSGQLEQLTLQMNNLKARLDQTAAGRYQQGQGSEGQQPNATQQGPSSGEWQRRAKRRNDDDSFAIAPTDTPKRVEQALTAEQDRAARQANFPSGISGDPKEAYEDAYGHLLRRDFKAAEVAFGNFLRSFPKDKLAGNAQYWLGESFFVRGQYRKAADSFLKGYTKYKNNEKAPESLLKLAMSLKQLGQADAACATFAELNSRFPSAPGHVKRRASAERKRAGC